MYLKERRNQARKECLLDFRDAVITGDEERYDKAQNKIIKRVQKEEQRQMGFRNVANNTFPRGRFFESRINEKRRNINSNNNSGNKG